MSKFYHPTILRVISVSLVAGMLISPSIKALGASEKNQDVVVVYKNSEGKEKIMDLANKVDHTFKSVPAVSATFTTSEIKKLKNDPDIKTVEKNIKFHIAQDDVRVLSSKELQTLTSETGEWNYAAVGAGKAYADGYTGKGIKVAVIDTGIAPHNDLKIAGGVSMVDYTSSYKDDEGHGTHVAGIIGALHNGQGIQGVAPNASLYAVKVMDQTGEGYLEDVLEGIDWAISNHMDIINLSLGTTDDSQLMHDMVDKAYKSGILVTAASGNDSGEVNYPAKYDSVIAVSAIDQNKTITYFSSRGSKVEVSAPGDSIISTYLGNGYAIGSGTSQASPHAAGMLAVLKEKYPNLTNVQLRTKLQEYAADLGVKGRDSLYGYGMVTYQSKVEEITPSNQLSEPSIILKARISMAARAVFDAERNPSNQSLDKAQTAVNKLPDSTLKRKFQTLLNRVKMKISS